MSKVITAYDYINNTNVMELEMDDNLSLTKRELIILVEGFRVELLKQILSKMEQKKKESEL